VREISIVVRAGDLGDPGEPSVALILPEGEEARAKKGRECEPNTIGKRRRRPLDLDRPDSKQRALPSSDVHNRPDRE
jgi:hypothetical protein